MIIAVLRTLWRGAVLCLYLALGLLQIFYYRLRHGPRWYLAPQGMQEIQRWMQRTSGLLGVQVTQYNRPQLQRTLFVANHVSFLDIIVIASIVPVRYLSKHTVAYWPIIGTLTKQTGTVFIKRGQRSLIHRTVEALDTALRETRPLVIFPEGTTGPGDHVKKFHTGLLQAAIDSQATVQAIGLRYLRHGNIDRTAAYIDKDNFVLKLLAIMAQPATQVQVHFCEPLLPSQQSRQTLAHIARNQIEQALGIPLTTTSH